jgi:anti-sigma B factor antagonist
MTSSFSAIRVQDMSDIYIGFDKISADRQHNLCCFSKPEAMPVMHETEQVADRRRGPAPRRPDLSLTADQTDAQQAGLRTTCEHHQDAAVLSVHGEVDLGTAPTLREALLSVLERETGPVVVDLSEVPFMDSTGVHILLEAPRQLESPNRSLAIVCREGSQVHRLLALVGLLDALTVHGSRESAVTGGDDILRSGSGRNSTPSEGDR